MQRNALLPAILALLLGACAETTTSPQAREVARIDESLAGTSAAPTANASWGETIYGLTADNRLITFSSGRANQISSTTEISGLASGENVIGIDFRPSDLNGNAIDDTGKLYAVTDASRLYVVDPATGIAGSAVTLSVAIVGSAVGVGFNPVPDRLRIHTTTNQNLRINVDNGATTVDVPLAYRVGDVNFGADPDLIATGYTNNDNDPATGTALFALDANRDALVGFPTDTGGPNGGQIATIGPLGFDLDLSGGFDISLSSGIAYGAFTTSASGKPTLYAIDLTTGAATKLGMLAQAKSALLGIAVKP